MLKFFKYNSTKILFSYLSSANFARNTNISKVPLISNKISNIEKDTKNENNKEVQEFKKIEEMINNAKKLKEETLEVKKINITDNKIEDTNENKDQKKIQSDFISGRKCCLAIIESKYRKIEDVYVLSNYRISPPPIIKNIIEIATKKGIKVKYITRDKITKLNKGKSADDILIKCTNRSYIELKNFTEFKSKYLHKEKQNLIVLIDRYSDAYGLGLIIKSSSYFGVNSIIQGKPERVSDLSHLVKFSDGATEFYEFLSVKFIKRFLQEAKREGWMIISSDIEKSADEKKELDEPNSQNESQVECKKISLNELPRDLLKKHKTILVLSTNNDSHLSSSDYKVIVSPPTPQTNKKYVDSLHPSVHAGLILKHLSLKSEIESETLII